MFILSKVAIKVLLGIIGAGTVVGGAGMLLKNDKGEPVISSLFSTDTAIAPEEPLAKEEAKSEEVASLPETKIEETEIAEPEIAGPVLPEFDVLRVEKDGSVVVAGRAPTNSMVEVFSNGELMAKGEAGSTGEFALVFDNPLPAGDHELVLRATPKDGEPLVSAEAGIVTVPEANDAEGEVMVMVQKSGEASRILQAPTAKVVVDEPVKDTTEVAALEQPVSEPVVKEEPIAEPQAKPAENTSTKPVLVQAVDVEPDKVFVAGTGEPGSTVRVYINGDLKGTTNVAPNGAFLFEMSSGLPAGKHDLRVDALARDGEEVISRAAVVIDHESESVAVAEVKAEKPDETAKAEVDPPVKAVEAETIVEETKAEETKIKETVAIITPDTKTETAEVETAPEEPKIETAVSEPSVKPAESTTLAATEAKPVIVTGRSVIIRRGDNLWRISRRMLGEGRKYTIIFSANDSQIKDPNRIYPGQVFDVPEEDSPVAGEAVKNSG